MNLATSCQAFYNTAVSNEKRLSCVYYHLVATVLRGSFGLLQSSRSYVADKGTSGDEETMEDGMFQPACNFTELATPVQVVRNPNIPGRMH